MQKKLSDTTVTNSKEEGRSIWAQEAVLYPSVQTVVNRGGGSTQKVGHICIRAFKIKAAMGQERAVLGPKSPALQAWPFTRSL